MAAIEPWQIDKDGRFEIRGVLPGSFQVLLQFGSARYSRFMRGDQIVHVTNADVDGVRIAPLPNGEVRGRLREDDGHRVDWSQVTVRLYSEQPQAQGSYSSGDAFDALYWDEMVPRADVNRDGSFELKEVPAGTYGLQVLFGSEAFRDSFTKAVNLAGKEISDAGFHVEGATYFLEVVVGAKGASIEGVVSDGQQQPAPDVGVICIPQKKRRERRDLYAFDRTDYQGHFRLRGLSPGEYQVFVLDDDTDEDEIADPEFVRTHEGLGQSIELESEHQNVVLKLTTPAE